MRIYQCSYGACGNWMMYNKAIDLRTLVYYLCFIRSSSPDLRPELAGGFFPTEPPGKPLEIYFRKAFSKYMYLVNLYI